MEEWFARSAVYKKEIVQQDKDFQLNTQINVLRENFTPTIGYSRQTFLTIKTLIFFEYFGGRPNLP